MISFDFHRELHRIAHVHGAKENEGHRVCLKVHFLIYPRFLGPLGRLLGRMSVHYNKNFRSLFLATLEPDHPIAKFMAFQVRSRRRPVRRSATDMALLPCPRLLPPGTPTWPPPPPALPRPRPTSSPLPNSSPARLQPLPDSSPSPTQAPALPRAVASLARTPVPPPSPPAPPLTTPHPPSSLGLDFYRSSSGQQPCTALKCTSVGPT